MGNSSSTEDTLPESQIVQLGLQYVPNRDVKTPKFFGPARSLFFRPGQARNKIFYCSPFIFKLNCSENILSSMFYNKTTNYLVLTDLQRRRLDFGSREEHTAKNYSTETLKNFIYKLAYTIFKNFLKFLNNFK